MAQCPEGFPPDPCPGVPWCPLPGGVLVGLVVAVAVVVVVPEPDPEPEPW